MKPQKQIFLWLATLALMLITACVNVNLKPAATFRSTDYKLREPTKPFEKMNSEQADRAWQSSKTGNTLAVLTECSEQKDPSLNSLENDTIQAMNNYKVISSDEYKFQDRAARRSLVEGSVDGIPVKMDLLVFKKNSCSYTLTYVGRASGFEKDHAAFEQFLMGFEVP